MTRPLDAEDGWLSPTGFMNPCDPGGHQSSLKMFADMDEEDAYRDGWIRLEGGEWYTPHHVHPVTVVQWHFLVDWHKQRSRFMPDWIWRV